MLNENLRNIRKSKSLSQEELARRLNVVRQTVSKWEQGSSVPDSEMLIRLAEVLETPVSVLLGETLSPQTPAEPGLQELAEKLEQLNAQLAQEKERRRKVWHLLFLLAALLSLGFCVIFVWGVTTQVLMEQSLGIIGGADGPTAIFVSSGPAGLWGLLPGAALFLAACVGFVRTRRRR